MSKSSYQIKELVVLDTDSSLLLKEACSRTTRHYFVLMRIDDALSLLKFHDSKYLLDTLREEGSVPNISASNFVALRQVFAA